MKRDSNRTPASGGPAGSTALQRLIEVDRIPDGGQDFAIEANEAERAALAASDGLVAIGRLEAHFHVAHRPRRSFNVAGRVTARVTQTCVVSLEAFETEISEEIDVDFAPAEELEKAEKERAQLREPAGTGDDVEDPPDPIVDGRIDLGALAAEFLALAREPYPKKPGVHFEEVVTEAPQDTGSPFAILRKLDKSS